MMMWICVIFLYFSDIFWVLASADEKLSKPPQGNHQEPLMVKAKVWRPQVSDINKTKTKDQNYKPRPPKVN